MLKSLISLPFRYQNVSYAPQWRVTVGNRICKSNQEKRKSLDENEQREKVDLKNMRPFLKSLRKHERRGSARDM